MQKTPKSLFLLFLTIFIDLLGFGLVIPILPNYIRGMTDSTYWVGITVALFSLMQFLATPYLGSLSDRHGRKPVLIITLALNALGYLVLSQASGLALLLLARLLSGFASGNISVAQAYIIDITPPEKRSKAMGLIGTAFGLGFIFGPPAGGWIMSTWGFEWIGYFAAILCTLNLLPAWLFLKESLHEKNPTGSIRLFSVREYVNAFKRPVIARLFIINFIYITAFFLFQVCATLFWEEHFGLNEKQRGYTFAFLGICTAVVQSLLVGLMSRKAGEKRLLIASNIGMGIVLVGLGLVPGDRFFPWELLLLLAMALANGPMGPSALTILSHHSGREEQGKIIGLYQSFTSLARIAGPLMGTALYAKHYLLPFFSGGVLMLINAWLAFKLVKYVGNREEIKKQQEESAGPLDVFH